MPLLIDTMERTADLVRSVNHLLATGGPRALSLRRIAGTIGISPSSLIHHYGSVDHLLRVSAFHTGKARLRDLERRWPGEGLLAHLPASPDDVVDARVWLAWCELWRSEDGLEPTVAEARDAERALLARQLDYALDRDGLDAMVALAEGLTTACCHPVGPMPVPRARTLMRRAHPRLGLPVVDPPAA